MGALADFKRKTLSLAEDIANELSTAFSGVMNAHVSFASPAT